MHLADEADFRAEHVGERLAVGEHVFRFVAGFAAEVEVREIAFAGAAESRGVDDFDAGGQHDRNGHGNRVAVFVSGVDGVGIEDRVIVLCAAHVLFFLGFAIGRPACDCRLLFGFQRRLFRARTDGRVDGHFLRARHGEDVRRVVDGFDPVAVGVTETAGRHGVGEGGRAGQHEFDFLAGFDLVAAHDGHASSVFRTP